MLVLGSKEKVTCGNCFSSLVVLKQTGERRIDGLE